MLADDVDRALSRINQILKTVLRLVKAARISYDEDRWVVIDDLGVGERGEVRAASVFGSRAYESNGSWDDGGDQELVVECRWAAILIRINGDVVFLQAFATIVGSVAGLPVGVYGLSHMPLPRNLPLRPTGLDLFEVPMWVPLNLLLTVHHALVSFGILSLLFFVGRHGRLAGVVGSKGDETKSRC